MSVIDLIVAAFVYYFPAYSVNGGMLFVGSMVEDGFPVSTKWIGPRKTLDGLFFAICCGGSVGFLVSSPSSKMRFHDLTRFHIYIERFIIGQN